MGRIYKRRLPGALSSGQMLQKLSELSLLSLLQGGNVWLAEDSAMVSLLDQCCTGQQDGGPVFAEEVEQVLSEWRRQQEEIHVSSSANHEDVASSARQTGRPSTSGSEGCTYSLTAVRLSLEEAFFLRYVLNALKIVQRAPDGTLQELGDQEVWDAFKSIRSNFVSSYAGYHHLKSKGWLPRSGLLYGVDYVLYQMHPLAVHSEFGVLIVPLAGPHKPDIRWMDVQITNRLINQVSKKLIILYLYECPESPGHGTPGCLEFFKAEERLIKRWVPTSTRFLTA
ncbi:hypothetical protein CEUSTIGMA_g660.t1 [Chlamydomonas eustigma]|uniref:tRNA-intron lyase n=1 Tax=Chlamydomonas eustigma TaxID=1157962 RepID=A0A250WQU2_9CHLO|nr:hypothetical protein CEUSTIGMA_g660.t1 [Chlamydomonas eustigma]|eukprot:GAX73207.1 hypothetical protein CEUSTIGMA_g660.t1 [Chlamydomonas eustigma]